MTVARQKLLAAFTLGWVAMALLVLITIHFCGK